MRVGKTEKWYQFKFGLREDIPLCCILRWCFDANRMACNHGVRFNRKGVYVPCGIFHQPHKKWGEWCGEVEERAASSYGAGACITSRPRA